VSLYNANVDFDSEIPLVALLALMHLLITLPILVLGGAGSGDQDGINDCALLHGHTVGFEMGFHRLKKLFAEVVLLKAGGGRSGSWSHLGSGH